MATAQRPLAVVTGASSGIGYELAKLCAKKGYDLVIAADRPEIETAANELRGLGVRVETLQTDLGTANGVSDLYHRAETLQRPVDILIANAGHGLGRAFLDQDFGEVRSVIETNVTGTIDLVHKIGRQMRARGTGRILIVGSIAGRIPGSFQAVYNASKAFVDSFAAALRNELKNSGVTVTCLMPGPTETDFFKRADLMDTKVGQQEKDDPVDVAKTGFDAMMRGEGSVVHGWKNKLEVAASAVTPSGVMAEQHRRMTEPGTGKH